MICNSVIPCLSNGLAKNDKIRSMFVLFSQLFWPFLRFGFFFENGRTHLTPKQSSMISWSIFGKIQ